jgi:hypothetical protein
MTGLCLVWGSFRRLWRNYLLKRLLERSGAFIHADRARGFDEPLYLFGVVLLWGSFACHFEFYSKKRR